MAIKASGSSLALSEIATFWGGSQPHSLSEYYAGGSNVFSGAEDEAGNDIPSSGNPLNVSDFYSTHTVTTGGTTNFTSSGTYTIPLGVSTLTITLYGAGGGGGMVCIPRYNRHSTARAARPSRPRAPRSRGAPRGAPSTVQPPVRSHQAGIRQAPVGPS